MKLPYFGVYSDKFRHQFHRFCKRFNIDCNIVFKPFKVSEYFSLKSALPDSLKSCLVYQYICSNDSTHRYIGKTKRHFLTRIREHQTSASAIRDHCASCGCFNSSNFKVLRVCATDYEAVITEAILIRSESPSLNNTLSSHGSSVFLTL